MTAGSLWAVGRKVYRVASVGGPDPQYPIVMVEQSRAPSVDAEIRDRAGALPEVFRADALRCLEPTTMNVERRWFDRRDVKPA